MKLYTSIIIIGFLALLSLISMIVKNNLIANNSKKWIIITLALIIVASFCECLGIYLDGSNSKIKLIYIMIRIPSIAIGYDIFNANVTSVSNILKNADDNMYFNKKEKSISKE